MPTSSRFGYNIGVENFEILEAKDTLDEEEKQIVV